MQIKKYIAAALSLAAVLLCACGDAAAAENSTQEPSNTKDVPVMETLNDDEINILTPSADGVTVLTEDTMGICVDVSNASEGYIMAKCAGSDTRLKFRITHGDEQYTYDFRADGEYEVYPLQMGAGSYDIKVFKNVEGTSYVQVFSAVFDADMSDEDRVFVYPSQYVWYTNEKNAVKLSFELCRGLNEPAEKVQRIYDYLVDYLSYDNDKAANVQKGYIPDLDEILELKKGICFDYSGLLAAMCRAQGIPVRLVIGYVQPDGLYHAWNQVYYDGRWQWMDATFGPKNTLTESAYTQDRRY